LQTFDSSKKKEVLAKKIFKNVNTKNLSAVPSDPYAHRWINFVRQRVFTKNAKDEESQRNEEFEKAQKEITDHI
jgi:hypothetical protein